MELSDGKLAGRSVLILEDEFLIAMDVEQTCLDWGAEGTIIVRSLDQLGDDPFSTHRFDAAILDMRLGGQSTTGFARQLLERGIPFVFATGFAGGGELNKDFPGVAVVAKPFAGAELMQTLAAAIRANGGSGDSA